MSANYEKVKTYYDNYINGLVPAWDKSRVRKAVGRWITETEYEQITGEPYEEV